MELKQKYSEYMKWVLSHLTEQRMRKCQETVPVWTHVSPGNSNKDFAERPQDLCALDNWSAARCSAAGKRRSRSGKKLELVAATATALSPSPSPTCGGLAGGSGGLNPGVNRKLPPERVRVGKAGQHSTPQQRQAILHSLALYVILELCFLAVSIFSWFPLPLF